jgi:hypothetical protein
LGHQSEGTTSDGRKADQIDDSQNVIHSRMLRVNPLGRLASIKLAGEGN